MKASKVSEFYSVVFLGSFNPLIFHPFWMLQKCLISEADISTDGLIVHEQMTHFKIGKWLDFNCTKTRCEFRISSADYVVPMLDLIKGALNALPETPLISIGINRGSIMQLSSSEDYYRLGATLAPLDLWNNSFKSPRLRTIAVEDTTSDVFEGTRRCVVIKPAEDTNLKYAVDFNMNNHYDLDPQKVIEALKVIDKNLNQNYLSFDSIVDNLLSHIE